MEKLDLKFWRHAFDRLVAAFEQAEVRLCGYDGAIGDGDHGTSMLLGLREVRETLRRDPVSSAGELFSRAGEAFLTAVGGVTGIVFGSLFEAAGQSVAGLPSLDAAALHRMFAAGLAAVKKRAKVVEGDKSMVDALSPAAEALAVAARRGESGSVALERAARAAEAGMDATIPMEGKVGRARYQAAKGRGNVDAGAASICLFFQTIADAAGISEQDAPHEAPRLPGS